MRRLSLSTGGTAHRPTTLSIDQPPSSPDQRLLYRLKTGFSVTEMRKG